MKIISKKQRGFTLFEIIVTIAILTVVISFGMTVDLSSFRGDTFLSEESKIVSALEKARSRAINSMFDTNHGVCYVEPNYIIFQGNTCASGETVSANSNITITWISPIVFDRLTGKTLSSTIHITDGIKSADIITNDEGTIEW